MLFTVKSYKIPRQNRYAVFFEYHKEVVERIKEIDHTNRKWDNSKKCWILHTKGLLHLITRYKGSDKIFFEFPEENGREKFIELIKKAKEEDIQKQKEIEILEKNKKKWLDFKIDLEENYENYRELVQKNLKKDIKLYPHQIIATMFINKVKNALLALDMGTGKSLSSIAYVEMNEFEKVFVITPNSLKFNYLEEVKKFTNSKGYILNSKSGKYKNKYTIEESKYIIVNYEFFSRKDINKIKDDLKNINIDTINCVISDESHRLKSSKSNLYKNYKKIFKNKKISKVFLSGTPAPNKSWELYTVLNQISPIDFATKKHFNEYYCGMIYNIENGFGWETDNSKQKLEELFHKISPYTYRKKKEDILDLPPKTYQKIILELSTKEEKIYNEIEKGIVDGMYNNPIFNPLTIMLKLRQYTSSIKFDAIKELIDNLLQENKKIVVVDSYKETINSLHKMYPNNSCLHTGDQSVEDRASMVKKFQDVNSDLMIFFATTQTANYGLTLTASSNMFIITQPYSLGEYKQVSDRIHRIGAKENVNIYTLIIKDTIDEYIFNSLEGKQKEISKVIDNENYNTTIDESALSEVVSKLKSKYKL